MIGIHEGFARKGTIPNVHPFFPESLVWNAGFLHQRLNKILETPVPDLISPVFAIQVPSSDSIGCRYNLVFHVCQLLKSTD